LRLPLAMPQTSFVAFASPDANGRLPCITKNTNSPCTFVEMFW
jgi:hypothetical protein